MQIKCHPQADLAGSWVLGSSAGRGMGGAGKPAPRASCPAPAPCCWVLCPSPGLCWWLIPTLATGKVSLKGEKHRKSPPLNHLPCLMGLILRPCTQSPYWCQPPLPLQCASQLTVGVRHTALSVFVQQASLRAGPPVCASDGRSAPGTRAFPPSFLLGGVRAPRRRLSEVSPCCLSSSATTEEKGRKKRRRKKERKEEKRKEKKSKAPWPSHLLLSTWPSQRGTCVLRPRPPGPHDTATACWERVLCPPGRS